MSIQTEPIPLQTFVSAMSNCFQDPDKWGRGYHASYSSQWETLCSELLSKCLTDEHTSLVQTALEAFAPKYRGAWVAWLSAHSRCASSFVTGPANFPVARMQRRHEVERKRSEELTAIVERFEKRVYRSIADPADLPISADLPNAPELLKAEAASEKNELERMKELNAAYRKFRKTLDKTEAQTELYKLCTPAEIEDMSGTFKHQGYYDAPFPTYALTNCRARMKRVAGRAMAIERVRQIPTQEWTGTQARVVDSAEDNRIQLFFEGKPAYEVRETLKKNGFRWAPSIGAWQAYRTRSQTLLTAKSIAGVA